MPKGPVGWKQYTPRKSGAAEAAAFKRETRERLRAARGAGLKMASVRKESNGAISDDQILAILEGRRVPIAVYRVLQAVLDRIEERA